MSHDGVYAAGVGEIADVLREEFADEARDRVLKAEELLTQVQKSGVGEEELISDIRDLALRFRGNAANFGYWHLGMVAHRLEDFLANVKKFPTSLYADLRTFLDVMSDILEGQVEPDVDATQLVRGLPAKVAFSESSVDVRDTEVLLVMLHGTATQFVEREMQACGYRISTCTSTFDALPMIVRSQPDMVVISAIMPELSGIDLAVALSNMPATRNVPCALITSLDPDDDYLKFLPEQVPVIHKGPSFGDDLADALSSLFLI